MLLKALSMGQVMEEKSDLLPVLKFIIQDYPESLEAKKSNEMIDIIENGYSKNEIVDFGDKFLFNYDDQAKNRVIVFLDEGQNSNLAKSKIVDFHREFFSRDKLKVTSKVYSSKQNIILISDFDTEADGKEYIRVYKKTRKYLLNLQKAKIFMITTDNLKILLILHFCVLDLKCI